MVVVDISILRGTEFVHQFPGGVEVTLDIPAGYEEANTKVFRMEADGTATDMQAACKDGKSSLCNQPFQYLCYCRTGKDGRGSTEGCE